MSELERALKNEISVSNMYDQLGYFTRFHINIYPMDKTTKQLSDIDVLAIKYDESLFNNNIIIEVKEQSNKFSDLFKLYGFKTYFGGYNSIFITEKIHPRTIPIAENLNINILTFKKLRELIKNREVIDVVQYEVKDGLKIFDCLEEVKTIDASLYWNYHYTWIERDPFKKFFIIQKMFELTTKYLLSNPESDDLMWFRKELFIIGLITVIDISSKIISLDDEIIKSYVENQIMSVGIPIESKISLKENMELIIKELKKAGMELDIEEVDIHPKYLDDLVSLVSLVIVNSELSQYILIKNESLHRLSFKKIEKHISEIVEQDDYKKIYRINSLLLSVLHNGPILPDFQLFI